MNFHKLTLCSQVTEMVLILIRNKLIIIDNAYFFLDNAYNKRIFLHRGEQNTHYGVCGAH